MSISHDIYNQLNQQDWDSLIKKLTIYTVYQFKFWGLIHEKGIKGYSPAEIVFEAIEKVYSGEWKWNPQKSDLLSYLKYHVVRGLIANLARNEEVVKSDSSEINLLLEQGEFKYSDAEEFNARQVIDFIKGKLEDDDLALKIFDGYCKGLKRADICEIHRISPREFTNAYKRFRRIIKSLRKESIINSIL